MNINKFLLTLLIFVTPLVIGAENDPDLLLESSLAQVKQNDFNKAKQLAYMALSIDSTRSDIYVHIANLYAWEHHADSSTLFIQKAYKLNPTNQELYDTWLNVLLWEKEYLMLLSTVDLAKQHGYANRYNLLIKQLEAYRGLGQIENAIAVLGLPEHRTFLDSSSLGALRQDLLFRSQKRSLNVSYSVDMVNAPVNQIQHLAGMEITQRFNNTLALVRINYAHRFGMDGIQLESDLYQSFKNKSYLYLNVGTGFNSAVFPSFRAGVEYTAPFLKTYEGSLGLRYLKFAQLPVVLLTGQLAKYMRSWWVGIRPFYTIKSNGNALTALLDIRKYETKPRNFTELELGYGNSPDERLLLENSGQYFGLDAWKIRLSTNRTIRVSDEIKLSAAYSYEEHTVGFFRNRLVLECIYKFRIP